MGNRARSTRQAARRRRETHSAGTAAGDVQPQGQRPASRAGRSGRIISSRRPDRRRRDAAPALAARPDGTAARPEGRRDDRRPLVHNGQPAMGIVGAHGLGRGRRLADVRVRHSLGRVDGVPHRVAAPLEYHGKMGELSLRGRASGKRPSPAWDCGCILFWRRRW